MSCITHILGVPWQHHDWKHGMAWIEGRSSRLTDMWGRQVTHRFVACHKQDVCTTCGAVREGADCSCDLSRAKQCTRRVNMVRRASERPHA